jgi:hypothetical protein
MRKEREIKSKSKSKSKSRKSKSRSKSKSRKSKSRKSKSRKSKSKKSKTSEIKSQSETVNQISSNQLSEINYPIISQIRKSPGKKIQKSRKKRGIPRIGNHYSQKTRDLSAPQRLEFRYYDGSCNLFAVVDLENDMNNPYLGQYPYHASINGSKISSLSETYLIIQVWAINNPSDDSYPYRIYSVQFNCCLTNEEIEQT